MLEERGGTDQQSSSKAEWEEGKDSIQLEMDVLNERGIKEKKKKNNPKLSHFKVDNVEQ